MLWAAPAHAWGPAAHIDFGAESLRYLARELVTLAFFAWPVVLLDYLRFRGGYPETALLRAPMAVQALTYAGFMLMFFVMGRYEGASFIYFQF